jgi:hypothetical protein
MSSTEILSPGWQICKLLNHPRAVNGRVFYLQGSPDALGFFEAIKLAELEGKHLRIPAPAQRYFFGSVPFGKKTVRVSENGEVWLSWSSGFGRDFEFAQLRYDSFRRIFFLLFR